MNKDVDRTKPISVGLGVWHFVRGACEVTDFDFSTDSIGLRIVATDELIPATLGQLGALDAEGNQAKPPVRIAWGIGANVAAIPDVVVEPESTERWATGEPLPAVDSKGTKRGKAGYIFPAGHSGAVRKPHHRSDAGNALRLVERHGKDLRYEVERREWLVWDGQRWRRDAVGRVMELAKDTVRAIYAEASKEADEDERKRIAAFARNSESLSHLKAMIELARTVAGVPVEAAELDTDVWLLNCINGTVDLRTGTLRPAERSDLVTKTTGIRYDPEAICPEWDAFVWWAMCERTDMVTYMRRAHGYSLTGDVSERIILFLHGSGSNGKSTWLEVISATYGEYAIQTEASTFEKPRNSGSGGARPDLVQLKGARYVTSSEMEDGTKLAVAMIKQITGNDTVSARPLYKDPLQFKPQFKPWIAANHKPKIPADDQAIWDRVRLIPFDARIGDELKERSLPEKLKAEGPGILAWAVRGCLEWQEYGMGTPTAVLQATDSYRNEMDTFTEFLLSLEDWPIGSAVDFGGQALHEAYMGWSRYDDDAPTLSIKEFNKHLASHHWIAKRTGAGIKWTPPAVSDQAVDWCAMAALVTPVEVALAAN
jgi:putative DNA primase/helicase